MWKDLTYINVTNKLLLFRSLGMKFTKNSRNSKCTTKSIAKSVKALSNNLSKSSYRLKQKMATRATFWTKKRCQILNEFTTIYGNAAECWAKNLNRLKMKYTRREKKWSTRMSSHWNKCFTRPNEGFWSFTKIFRESLKLRWILLLLILCKPLPRWPKVFLR